MPKTRKALLLSVAAIMLGQLSGCFSSVLSDVFFEIGPFLL